MIRDEVLFPHDENGNTLWHMYQEGADLNVIYEIEFSILFEDEQHTRHCALYLLQEEQKITLSEYENDEQELEWQIKIYVSMLPIYTEIIDLEAWFSKIAAQFRGQYEGWGCVVNMFDQPMTEYQSDLEK